MVFWVSHSVDYCIKIKYNNFPSSHVVVEVSCISPQPCSQGPLLMSPGVRETKEKLERTLGTRLIQSSGHIIKILHVWALSIQQKFQSEISEIPRAQWNIHSGCSELTQTTVRLLLHL